MNMTMAKRIAAKSTHDRYNHVSMISSGGKILAVGYNRNGEHAERNTLRRLLNARKNNDNVPKNLTLTSLMFKKRSEALGNSRPCSDCMRAITPFVKSIVFIENDSWNEISGINFDQLVNLK